jgi:predicted nucleic acid-binding protein
VTIGPTRAQLACDVAIACKLRGADALYVWLASKERLPLCTLDVEMHTRGAALCQTIAP